MLEVEEVMEDAEKQNHLNDNNVEAQKSVHDKQLAIVAEVQEVVQLDKATPTANNLKSPGAGNEKKNNGNIEGTGNNLNYVALMINPTIDNNAEHVSKEIEPKEIRAYEQLNKEK